MKYLENAEGSNRNTAIRNEINTFNSNGRINNNRLNCIHHGERIEPHCNPKQFIGYTPTGARSIGYPTPSFTTAQQAT
jgi:hypothetical protein